MSTGACRRCRGFDPLDGRTPVCQCGRLWAVDDIDWDQVLHTLLVRSGNRCEARTPDCLGGRFGKGLTTGYVGGLSRRQVSIHHRRPRKSGGTSRAEVHSLANLLLLCGSGTIGCHGFVESHRTIAEARGYLIREGVDEVADPAIVPVTLPSGRRVLLDELAPAYLDTAGGWGFGVPDWEAAA